MAGRWAIGNKRKDSPQPHAEREVYLKRGSPVTQKRVGYTLLELVLVMTIILITASLAIPAIQGMMTDTRQKAARDMVRARWADIRGQAMKEGRPYKFSVIDGTGKFKIEPEDSDAPSDSDEPPLIVEGELPEEVLFAMDQSSTGPGDGGGSDYQVVAVYLADGTARDDVTIMFGKKGAQPIGLQLRALTGAVTMVDQTQDKQP